MRDLRKVAYFSIVIADILDRLLWRIRPYEKNPGMTDDFVDRSMRVMEDSFEKYGANKDFEKILDRMEEITKEGKTIIDPGIPAKPLIGIVGEIYLRTHVLANQDLIRVLEKYGAEVMNASVAEWLNYTAYDRFREAKIGFWFSLKQHRLGPMKEYLRKIIGFGGDLLYQEFRQNQAYKRVRELICLAEDHKVAGLDNILKEKDLFCFDVGTEACLSIAGIAKYAMEGYNGMVNVYPFTCMPSMITSSIVKPLMNKLRIPYLDTPYDSGFQPGRETAIRTFMYQAYQHFKRNGIKRRT